MTISSYLSSFGEISTIRREVLLDELDRVWHELKLDNSKRLSEQQEKVAAFYSHEVWILNGLFSEQDPVSRKHRMQPQRYDQRSNQRLLRCPSSEFFQFRLLAIHSPDEFIG